jgi:glycine betaine/proline transport system ATP-binding protein
LPALQRETRLVVINVRRSLNDALAVGDCLTVMRDGRIERIGALEDVIRRPPNQAVAEVLDL